MLLAILLCLCRCVDAADPAESVELPKLPTLISAQPLYGIFRFGTAEQNRVWAVLDTSTKDGSVYDVLYLDLNADRDLTQSSERFVGQKATIASEVSCMFSIKRFVEPGTRREHTEFTVTWRPHRVSYRMKWLGDKVTVGGYGSEPNEYGNFSSSPATAPVFVLGHDGPFQFQHWMSGTLPRGQGNDFKVFMGAMGQGRGSFTSVDDKFLPALDYVVATLIYRDRSGTRREARFDLKDRC